MEQKDFIIEELKKFSPEVAAMIRNLIKQIGENYQTLTDDELKEMLLSKTTRLVVVRHAEKIVGMITVSLVRIPYRKKAYLDDVVVDKAFRGHGLGTKLFEKALTLAKEEKAVFAEFTSAPHRTAANRLYQKLGFQKTETNVYRLTFNHE